MEPSLEPLRQSPMLMELPIGLLMLVVTLLVHGAGLRIVTMRFNRSWSRITLRTPRWRINALLGVFVGLLAALHMLETLVFAFPLYWLGALQSMHDSYFYVLESYTTLGGGEVRPVERWRLLGPIIAMAGVFSVGWTVSVLVSIMAQINSLDRAHAAAAMREHSASAGAGPPGDQKDGG